MKSDQTGVAPLKSTLWHDVLANFVGKGATVGLLLVSTPLYLQFAGIEAFALISFATTLQSVMVLFDLGVGTTINRILATARVRGVSSGVASATFRLERWSIGLTLAIGALSVATFPSILPAWLQVSPDTMPGGSWVFVFMSLAVVSQLPATFYTGVLNGLGQQQILNWFVAIMAFVKLGGGAILLSLSPKLDWFFAWQGASNVILLLLLRHVYRKNIGSSDIRSVSEAFSLRGHIPYALGVGATAAMGVMLTQIDKLLLSRLLPLAEFGHYMLGWALCSGIFMCALPATTACFPRLTGSVNAPGHATRDIFYTGCQIIAATAIPVAALVIVFPQQILAIWTGENCSVKNAHETVSLLALGAMLNVFCQMPHALLLAHGKSRVGLMANMLMVLLIIPLLIFLVSRYGLIGAGWTWVVLNAGYLFVGNSLILAWLLPRNLSQWFRACVVVPVAVVFIPMIGAAILVSVPVERSFASIFALCFIFLSVSRAAVSVCARHAILFCHRKSHYIGVPLLACPVYDVSKENTLN